MKWWPLLALIVSPLVSAVTLDELQQRFTGQPVQPSSAGPVPGRPQGA